MKYIYKSNEDLERKGLGLIDKESK